MNIVAENLGKRFNTEWIFKNLNYTFCNNGTYAITGPNGSGKSTLLRILAGMIPSSQGTLTYLEGQKTIEEDKIFRLISFTAPAQELIEEYTLSEMITFHLRFRKFRNNLKEKEFMEKIHLLNSANKEVRNMSSGMKQRLKLGLALYTDSKVLLLDEPTVNLDADGIKWYADEILSCTENRLTLISSNQKYEYEICKEILDLAVLRKTS